MMCVFAKHGGRGKCKFNGCTPATRKRKVAVAPYMAVEESRAPWWVLPPPPQTRVSVANTVAVQINALLYQQDGQLLQDLYHARRKRLLRTGRMQDSCKQSRRQLQEACQQVMQLTRVLNHVLIPKITVIDTQPPIGRLHTQYNK